MSRPIRCGKAPLGTDPAVSATVTSIRVQANGLQPGSRALESSRRFERLLTDLVSALTRASADELDRCIRHGLGRLASQAGVERGSFARLSRSGDLPTVTHSFGRARDRSSPSVHALQGGVRPITSREGLRC